MRNFRIFPSLLLIGTLIAVGCHNGAAPPASNAAQGVSIVPAATPESPPQAPLEDDAGVLARKTREYARNMSPLLDQQDSQSSGPAALNLRRRFRSPVLRRLPRRRLSRLRRRTTRRITRPVSPPPR
jgi:hypothetical protein